MDETSLKGLKKRARRLLHELRTKQHPAEAVRPVSLPARAGEISRFLVIYRKDNCYEKHT